MPLQGRLTKTGLTCHQDGRWGRNLIPGGILRYISDGDVQSPFLGLKFAI